MTFKPTLQNQAASSTCLRLTAHGSPDTPILHSNIALSTTSRAAHREEIGLTFRPCNTAPARPFSAMMDDGAPPIPVALGLAGPQIEMYEVHYTTKYMA